MFRLDLKAVYGYLFFFVISTDKNLPSEHNLFGHLISHLKEEPALLNICGQPYIIPPQCTFLMSDSSNLQPLIDHG